MFLQGVIDRVDTCEDDDEILMKVIDYKSGMKKFELEDFYYGLEMQLVIYMNAAEEIYKEKKVRAIGVSNFEPQHLLPILDNGTIVPMVDQVCFHIGNRQENTVAKCKENNIQLMAYSPLATGGLVNDQYIAEIAKKYNATIPQICVRYCIQKGAIPIPKSTKEERIISNVQVDFVMSDEDMEYLDKK